MFYLLNYSKSRNFLISATTDIAAKADDLGLSGRDKPSILKKDLPKSPEISNS